MFNHQPPLRLLTRASLLPVVLVMLTQCSSSPTAGNTANSKIGDLPENAVTDSYQTATSPLDDLGLREDDIPPMLQTTLREPYAHSPKMSCALIRAEIAKLDEVLGPDVDNPQVKAANATEDDFGDTVVGKGVDIAHDSVVDFVRAQTSILPFRSVIRHVTGAKKHEKQVARAQEAGKLRRAYLKGMLQANDKCALPITPGVHIQEADAAPVPAQ